MADAGWLLWCIFLCSRQYFEQFVKHVLTFGLYYFVYPGPYETFRGSNFYFWIGIVFLTGQVIFVPEWPKGEFVSL
jgi:hypothetical protein